MKWIYSLKITDFFYSDNRGKALLFRKSLYLALLVNMLLMIPNWESFYGTETIMHPYRGFNTWLSAGVNYLTSFTHEYIYLFIAIVHLTFLVIGILNYMPRLVPIAVYISTLILYNRAEFVSDGGYHLILIMLFYGIFMSDTKKHNIAAGIINNFALLAVQAQLALVYFTGGILKLAGEKWGIGEGIYYSLSYNLYSHPGIRDFFFKSDFLLYSTNFFVLAFQLLFPLVLFIKTVRMPMFFIGIVFHLSTIFINGLTGFGMFMLASYVVFLKESDVQKLRFLLTRNRVQA